MASELECPVCAADVPLSGDENVGDEVHCPFCHAPARVSKKPGSDEDDELELEEDY